MSEAKRTSDTASENALIIGTDIVGFSKLDKEWKLVKAFKNFTKLVRRCFETALRDCNRNGDVLLKYLPTGDGCFIVIKGSERTLALRLAKLLCTASLTERLSVDKQILRLRVGLYRGNVQRVEKDLNDQVNYVGYGINSAQRVMDMARPSQLLIGDPLGKELMDSPPRGTEITFFGVFPDKHGIEHKIHGVHRVLGRKQHGDLASPKAKLAVEVSPDSWRLLEPELQKAMKVADARWTAALMRQAAGRADEGRRLVEHYCRQELRSTLERLKGKAGCIVVPDYSGAVANILNLIENSRGPGQALFQGVATMPAQLWEKENEKGLARILAVQEILVEKGRLKVERVHVRREELTDEQAQDDFVAKHRLLGNNSLRTATVTDGRVEDWEDFVLLSVPLGSNRRPLELVITSDFYRRLWSVQPYREYEQFSAVYNAMKQYEVAEIWFAPQAVATFKTKWKQSLSKASKAKKAN